MTHLGAVAPATGDSVGVLEAEILYLDPDTAPLIAEVDAILCAELTPTRRPPVPPVTGCALMGPGRLVGPGLRWSALGRRPAQPVRAVQRSPPTPPQPRPTANNRGKAGDGITTDLAERPAPGQKAAPHTAEDANARTRRFHGGGQPGRIGAIATSTDHRQIPLIISSFRRINEMR
jgi:hypothetical protein